MISRLREENQRLKDEIARLKGEQGKPDIKPSRTTGDNSSERRRKDREKRKRQKRGGRQIEVDRTERCPADPESLPSDARYRDSPPTVTQSMFSRSSSGSGPRSGSRERSF